MTVRSRRGFRPALVLVAAVAMLLGLVVGPGLATAAPTPPAPGDEGGTPLLRDVIETTSRGYVEARDAVEVSRKRQLALALELQKVELKIAELEPEVSQVAVIAYRNGRIGPVSMLLNSSSPDNFLARAESLDILAIRDNGKLRELNEALDLAKQANLAIEAALAEEKKQLAIMARQKQEAERALKLAGGKSTGGYVSATSPVARPAPRNADGSWPRERCSVNDPTPADGCITPRTLHALKESQRVGFTRYVSCYRPGGPYEHPKGRACDFSSEKNGFGGDARGGDRLYGNNLAAFLVRNADRLGVLYVIWYRQFWSPATGWKSYSGAYGDPSSDHTNHVHLSMI